MTTEHYSRAVAPVHPLVKRLIAASVLPPECTRFELVIEMNKPITIRAEYFATKEHLEALACAVEECGIDNIERSVRLNIANEQQP